MSCYGKGGGKGGVNQPHQHRDRKRRLRLLAVPDQIFRDRRATALGQIPRRPALRMLGITHIARGLGMDADRIQGDEQGMDEDGEQRVKHMGDEHDALDEQQE